MNAKVADFVSLRKPYLIQFRRQFLELHDLRTYVNHGIPCFIYVKLGIARNSMLHAFESWNSMIYVLT